MAALHGARSEEEVARALGVPIEAVALTRDVEVVDLHLDTFIPHRLWRYDWFARHRGGPLGRHLFGHVDWPRLADGGLTSAIWSITTNPFRSAEKRWSAFEANLTRIRGLIDGSDGRMRLVRDLSELRAARADGAHAAMLGIQGGNALDAAPDGAAFLEHGDIVRITIVHLTNASLGASSSPVHHLRRHRGLTEAGRDLIARCDAARVFVDLAHIHEEAFWDAVDVHDPGLPLIATHTGVDGVTPHWRNLTDRQVRAVADSGGVVGVIFSPNFLRRPGGPRDGRMILEHLEHIIDVAGEEAAAIGSDFDGAISPPRDVAGADAYPVLVHDMLSAGWDEARIRRVMGENSLRALGHLRPGPGR